MNRSYVHSETEDCTDNKVSILCPEEIVSPLAEEKAGMRETGINTGYTDLQKEVAERAHDMIMTNLERHITIAEFSQTLHASATQVKSCFHKVYGMPIYAYARARRMEAASSLLSETEESVLEIAGKYGYENGSKFARAFRAVMGVSPSEYRRRLKWEKENQAFCTEKNDEK